MTAYLFNCKKKCTTLTSRTLRTLANAAIGALAFSLSSSNWAAYTVRVPVDFQSKSTPQYSPLVQLTLTAELVPYFNWNNRCADIELQQTNGNILPHDVSSCDAESQTAVIWLRPPKVPQAPDFVRLFLLYADTDVAADSKTTAHATAESKVNTHAKADLPVSADAKADSNANAETKSDAKIKIDANAESKPNVDANADLPVNPDATAGAKVNSGANAKANAVATADAKAAAKSEKEAKRTLQKQQAADDIAYVVLTDALQARVDLVVAKNVAAPEKRTTDHVRFSLTVTNQGPIDARNVNISDPVPLGFTNILNISDGGSMDNLGNVNWVIPALAVGDSVTVTFDATQSK